MANYSVNTGLPKDMTEDQILTLKPVLEGIRDGFVGDMFEPAVSTQYITATYNKQNPTTTLDGYTVEMILAYEAPKTLIEGV